MLTPRTITYDQSLPAKNLPFPPCGRRVSPIQAASCHLQSGHGECLPATQLYLSVFTCPTVSLDLPSDSHRTPARASRPDNLTFSTPRPARLTHPDREYFPPVGCRREPPGHTSYIVMSLPVQRSESWSPVGRRRGAPGQTILLLCLYLSNAASLNLRLDAGEVLPARQSYFILSLPVQRSESWSPVGRRRGAPGQTILLSSVFTCPTQRVLISGWTPARCSRPDNLTFSVFTCPTQQVLVSRWMPARCSRPDNLTFPVFTCPTKQVLVSRWTPARCSRPDNLTFPVFTCPTKQVLVSRWTPARCSRPDKSYFSCLYLSNTASLNLLLDAGEVLPARQTLFRLLAPKISNPVERDIPGRFGNLILQSTTGEAPPPSSQVSISPQMPQEPPGWTTSPFPPASAKLTHQTGGHAHQLDVG